VSTLETWATLDGGDDEGAGENRLGSYVLERRIGIGGMGEVFVARHAQTGERVALKTSRRDHPKHRYRFKREYRALVDITHPNLVRFGELHMVDTGPSFLTMELLDGEHFVKWVRGSLPEGRVPDIARLEAALRQLVEGLAFLHEQGYVHRDLKPSNVLVTREGRVVILDFGIVLEPTESQLGLTNEGQALGTPLYMAPEQAAGRSSPAADCYSLGAILFESLTGRAPHASSMLEFSTPRTPESRLPLEAIPVRLRDLCVRLLRRDPARRPDCAEILARLGEPERRARASEGPFVGREAELAELDRAFARLAAGGPVVVHVAGRSGQGKSSLVRQWLATLQRTREVAVLRGRCRERESVPYKGIDAVIDALGIQLRHLEPSRLPSLPKEQTEALTQVFPVLQELWPRESDQPPRFEAEEARNLCWVALRELLAALGRVRPVVIVIDDLQWSDLDSVAVLAALRGPPDPPACLLVLTYRAENREGELVAALERDAPPDHHQIELGSLGDHEATELAAMLLREQQDSPGEPGLLRARAEAIALRCAGNPFFIGQMVLGGSTSVGADLDALVVARLAGLAGPERRVIEVVAVAGGPVASAVVLALAPDATLATIERLRDLGLLVRSETWQHAGAREGVGGALVEAAHDRIRENTLAELDAHARAAIHRGLGEQLLGRYAEHPRDDDIFALVDHLDAGVVDIDELDASWRLELAQLAERAGRRALASVAWSSARRYFAFAHRLTAPWQGEARRGAGPRAMCLAIAFGRAQAEAMCRSEVADAAFDDLLTWSMSDAEIGEIVARRVAILWAFGRSVEAVAVARTGLARLRSSVPASPSLPRALASLVRGMLTLGRRSSEQLRHADDIADERVRACIDILGEASGPAYAYHPALYLFFVGLFARLQSQGHHPRIGYAMAMLAISMGILGKGGEAAAICDRAIDLAKHRNMRPRDLIRTKITARFFVWPTTRPFPALVADVEALHDEACDHGLRDDAGLAAASGGMTSTFTDLPLRSLRALLLRCEQRNPGFWSAEYLNTVTFVRRFIDALVDGQPTLDADELGPECAPLIRYTAMALQLGVELARADHARASELLDRLPSDHARVLMGMSTTPRLETYVALVESWRASRGDAKQRRRSLRRMRDALALTRRWAKTGPDNYAPMVALVEAELARVEGRDEPAMAAYERARSLALANRHAELAGLASTRLASFAHARGRTLLAEAAFKAGLETYESWGADALVERLEALGLTGLA
jgi:predicted Ser/Thr protein kinase